MTSRRLLAGVLAAAVTAAAVLALGRVGFHGPAGGTGAAPATPAPSAPSGGPPPASSTNRPAAGGTIAPGADSGAGRDTTDIGDILEPMAAQLADLLEHLRDQCAAAQRPENLSSPAVAKRCIETAEAAASTVDLVRSTLASAGGRDVPSGVHARWAHDLTGAGAQIRASLAPVRQSVDRTLASGGPSAAAFREFGHLRDRIDRVLLELDRP
jgi:hypothetical protein